MKAETGVPVVSRPRAIWVAHRGVGLRRIGLTCAVAGGSIRYEQRLHHTISRI